MAKIFKRDWTPMYTVQDVHGEYWDIHEDYKISKESDFRVLKGFPYGHNPQNSTCTFTSYILTPELASYIKEYSTKEATQILGISHYTVHRFRKELNLVKPKRKKDKEWLLKHKEDILTLPYDLLKEKYGLTAMQIKKTVKWLDDLTYPEKNKASRLNMHQYEKEQFFQNNKHQFIGLSVEEIQEKTQKTKKACKEIYDRIAREHAALTFSEKFQKQEREKKEWLLAHQDIILAKDKSVEDIAQVLNKNYRQVLRMRNRLRKELDLPKVTDAVNQWLLDNQEVLLSSLPACKIAQKLNLTKGAAVRYRQKARLLVKKPTHRDVLQKWRMKHKDILLSNDLTIKQIAKELRKTERYIVKQRTAVRKMFDVDLKKQKMERNKLLIENKDEFLSASNKFLSQKYNLTEGQVDYYRKKLKASLLEKATAC